LVPFWEDPKPFLKEIAGTFKKTLDKKSEVTTIMNTFMFGVTS
jgi:hypothetical protein